MAEVLLKIVFYGRIHHSLHEMYTYRRAHKMHLSSLRNNYER